MFLNSLIEPSWIDRSKEPYNLRYIPYFEGYWALRECLASTQQPSSPGLSATAGDGVKQSSELAHRRTHRPLSSSFFVDYIWNFRIL